LSVEQGSCLDSLIKGATFAEDLLKGLAQLNSVGLASGGKAIKGIFAEVVIFGD